MKGLGLGDLDLSFDLGDLGDLSLDDDDGAPDQRDMIRESWSIIIDCDDEAEQIAMIEELESRGYYAQAIIT